MKNPFENAIKCLEHDGDSDFQFNDEEQKVAIRVLEAAGKVDKVLAIKTLQRLYHPMFQEKGRPVSVPIFDTIMPLLESLPSQEPR